MAPDYADGAPSGTIRRASRDSRFPRAISSEAGGDVRQGPLYATPAFVEYLYPAAQLGEPVVEMHVVQRPGIRGTRQAEA